MPFTSDDRAAIKLVREEKGSGAKRILQEFPNKQWPRTTVRMVYQDSVTSFNDLKEKILHLILSKLGKFRGAVFWPTL